MIINADWIEWYGGECPVAADASVEISLRCRELNRGSAGGFDWRHNTPRFAYEGDDDIIAYRLNKES
ncbi:hypothetical protein [Mesorhizobium sp.]|uniref:hypothetical protein n=1 Tax=Mesorhizobium sp. TaxID=1871066 RepID=UPI001215FFFE|nr:hypothetical protein [Mesorhizobium sp.]TIL38508.1 MAG: hypothetical protein E5Y82_13470 [Mesorhizobium sp.]